MENCLKLITRYLTLTPRVHLQNPREFIITCIVKFAEFCPSLNADAAAAIAVTSVAFIILLVVIWVSFSPSIF